MSNTNPYSDLVNIMRLQGAATYVAPLYIGEVVKELPDIEIKVGKLPLYKEDLRIDDWIMKEYSTIGYSCNINMCSGGVIGQATVGEHGTVSVMCNKANGCPAKCTKPSGIQYKDLQDCKNCKVKCKKEVYVENRLNIGDKVLLYKDSNDIFTIINKITNFK